MSYSILPTHRFEKELKRLVKKFPSLKIEFKELIEEITKTHNLELLLAIIVVKFDQPLKAKEKCKSGSARTITYIYVDGETVYLLTIYDKSEKENLKPNELKMMIVHLELE